MALWRKNKFGESIEVEKYCCGSCKFYEFEREDKDNYCKEYGKYYPMNDHCSKWEEFGGTSSDSVCFLTTCCCEYKGLPDDCYELTRMRKFRDEVLKKSMSGNALVEQYYKIAPLIVEKLEQQENRAEILEEMYQKILGIVALLEEGKESEAIAKYVLMVYEVEKIVN